MVALGSVMMPATVIMTCSSYFTMANTMIMSTATMIMSTASGLIAVANKERNIWQCTGCSNTTDFSQVRIPYAYKLFLQELESMNISSRLLPETRLRALAEAGTRA
jgi:DNA-directed RNA polymerase beta subunit